MNILEQLSSATGQHESNLELIEECLSNPAMLHTIAEGLRAGSSAERNDCAKIVLGVAQRSPSHVSGFISDIVEMVSDPLIAIAKSGLRIMTCIVRDAPQDVFAQRQLLFDICMAETTLSVHAVRVINELNKHSANYRGHLRGITGRILRQCSDRYLGKFTDALSDAIGFSADLKSYIRASATERAPQIESKADRALFDKVLDGISKASN